MDATALNKISCGVYIITSGKEGRNSGQIANTVVQVASEPPLVVVSINKENYTHELIKQSGFYAVSILSREAPISFIGNFGSKSGRDSDKFQGIDYRIGQTGARIVLNHAVAYFEAKVVNEIDAKTHTIFMGEVVDAQVLSDDPLMIYDTYHVLSLIFGPV